MILDKFFQNSRFHKFKRNSKLKTLISEILFNFFLSVFFLWDHSLVSMEVYGRCIQLWFKLSVKWFSSKNFVITDRGSKLILIWSIINIAMNDFDIILKWKRVLENKHRNIAMIVSKDLHCRYNYRYFYVFCLQNF